MNTSLNYPTTTMVQNVTLQNLIRVCRDAYDGYLQAAQSVRSAPYKTLFAEYAHQRNRFAQELMNHLAMARSEDGGKTLNSLDSETPNTWAAIYEATLSGEAVAILAACEEAEDVAVRAYETALGAKLPADTWQMIQKQYEQILKAHIRIRDLRDIYRK